MAIRFVKISYFTGNCSKLSRSEKAAETDESYSARPGLAVIKYVHMRSNLNLDNFFRPARTPRHRFSAPDAVGHNRKVKAHESSQESGLVAGYFKTSYFAGNRS